MDKKIANDTLPKIKSIDFLFFNIKNNRINGRIPILIFSYTFQELYSEFKILNIISE